MRQNHIFKALVVRFPEHIACRAEETIAWNPINNILKYSSFEFMRALEKEEDFVKYLQRSTGGQGEDGGRQPQMMRKGKVGDWRNYFTPEQSRRMDDRFHSKTRGTLLENIWTEEMAYTHDSN
ncbi:sulfotransferase 1C4 [Nephila pilipes]|uniref:Sulfotransferase 1C4 n=1 Tax=Nephila pilipes TaxID=299642 RepID=A0A8X6TU44_NEPPI|nr:sulfotransferase 1C4 [Nephila pilipes]